MFNVYLCNTLDVNFVVKAMGAICEANICG
jgi:hypothetical protein